MSKSSLTPTEKARKTESKLRLAIGDKGRDHLCKVLNIKDGTASKFMAGNKDDCKINVVSLSKLIESLGFKLVDGNAQIVPKGHAAVPGDIAVAALHNSRLGLDYLEGSLVEQGFMSVEDNEE